MTNFHQGIFLMPGIPSSSTCFERRLTPDMPRPSTQFVVDKLMTATYADDMFIETNVMRQQDRFRICANYLLPFLIQLWFCNHPVTDHHIATMHCTVQPTQNSTFRTVVMIAVGRSGMPLPSALEPPIGLVHHPLCRALQHIASFTS